MRVGDPPIGGRYSLVEPFGADERFAGGKVQTWRARDTLVERDVVLRVLTPGGNSAKLFLDRALEMSLIAHPALGMVYEAVDLGDYAIVVSEWIDGTSLADTLQAHGPLTPATARATLGAVAEAISEAHHAGLPIGGITAERVVLRDNASVTVTAVPALFADERGDLQQLGALLYAALTGEEPDPDEPELARHLPRGIPRDLATLCQRALDPDATRQLGSVAAFAAVLRPRLRPPSQPSATAGRAGDRLRGMDPDPAPMTHDTAPAGALPRAASEPDDPPTELRTQPLPSVAAHPGLAVDPNAADGVETGAGWPNPGGPATAAPPVADPDDPVGAADSDEYLEDGDPGDDRAGSRLASRASALGEAATTAGAAALGAVAGAVRRFGTTKEGEDKFGTTKEGEADFESRSDSDGRRAVAEARLADKRTPDTGESWANDWDDSVEEYDPWEDDTGTWGSYDDSGDEPGAGGSAEGGRTRRRVLLYAVPLAALLLVILLGVFVGKEFSAVVTDSESSAAVTEDTDSATDPASTDPASTDPASTDAPAAPVALPPVGAAVFDPFGDGQPENSDDVGRSFDGDIGSAWQTLQYQGTPEFGNLKPGVGVIFDLGQERTINAVELATNLPGSAVEIRVGAAPDAALDSYPVVGTLDPFPENGSVTLAEPARARYVIVWFVRLVQADGGFQGALAECRVLGT